MSVLDTFYVVFDLKVEALKKGVDEIKSWMETTKKRFIDLESNLKKVEKATDPIANGFDKVGRSLFRLGAGYFSARSLFKGFEEALDYGINLDIVSRTLGVNRKELEAWGYAVQRTGGDLKSFESSVIGFANHLNASLPDALKALPLLAESLSNMSTTRALQYGSMLGLDPATITFLRENKNELKNILKAQSDLGLMTDSTAERMRNFNKAWIDAKHEMRSVFTSVEGDALPALTNLAKGFTFLTEKIRENGTVVTVFLGALVLALSPLKPYLAVILGLIFAYEKISSFLAPTGLTDFDDPKNKSKRIDPTKTSQFLELMGYKKNGQEDNTRALNNFNLANTSPISKVSNTNAITNSTTQANKEINITLGDVIVHTQATDGKAVSNEIGKTLNEQIRQAISNLDDGVVA